MEEAFITEVPILTSSKSFTYHPRCVAHGRAKDKRSCLPCIQERRVRLENEMKDLTKEERDFQVYLRMGSGYCPPCIYSFIADERPFVEVRPDGKYKNLITSLR